MSSPKVEVEVFGPRDVFVRKNLAKPSHVEVVTLMLRPALCHNACGLYYVPAKADGVCPDCNEPPKAWRVGEAEPIDITVHMAFGNAIDIDFLRTHGKVTGFVINAPIARGIVGKPPG